MAFKIGSKIAITDNSVINVTDTSDSDGGLVTSREGNLNFNVATGTIFRIPYTENARLKEKLTISGWPEPGEIKKITVLSDARGVPKTSPVLGSFSHNSGLQQSGTSGAQRYAFGFNYGNNGNYLYHQDGDAGYSYVRRHSLATPWRADSDANNYDQNVRYDTNFRSITRYTYVGAPFFDNTGNKVFFCYNERYIDEFTLSTAWDLTSSNTFIATYDLANYTSDVSPQFPVGGPIWYADGHVLMGADRDGSPSSQVFAAYVETAYDLSTIYETKNHNPSTGSSFLENAVFNNNGDKIYLNDRGDEIWEHTLSTPFDIDTISGSYNTFTYTDYPGYPAASTTLRIKCKRFIDNDDEFQFGLDVTSPTVFDQFETYSTNITTTSRRANFLWDSDKISMLNDSAPPNTDSGETDYLEFLVFDSATGAVQTEFVNNLYHI